MSRLRRSVDDWLPTLSRLMALAIRGVAVVGLVLEMTVDKFQNPSAFLPLCLLAGLPDALAYRQMLRGQLQDELEREREAEREREKDRP